MFRPYYILLVGLILTGCASHPTISPIPLKQGETYLGYTLSVENAMPMIFYRRGMSDNWDFGVRLGMPLYGTGIDVSRILAVKPDRTDLINLAYSINPNGNFDYTYYRVKRKQKEKKDGVVVRKLRYYGLRGMLIRNGITGRTSSRFGILFGGAPSIKGKDAESVPNFYRFQWEVGYFHDFSSMPLKAVLSPTAFNSDHDLWLKRFADFPHQEGGFPTEHSRLTGLSLRITFPLGDSKSPKFVSEKQKAKMAKKEAKKKKKEEAKAKKEETSP